jgi:hypothetical protein
MKGGEAADGCCDDAPAEAGRVRPARDDGDNWDDEDDGGR